MPRINTGHHLDPQAEPNPTHFIHNVAPTSTPDPKPKLAGEPHVPVVPLPWVEHAAPQSSREQYPEPRGLTATLTKNLALTVKHEDFF